MNKVAAGGHRELRAPDLAALAVASVAVGVAVSAIMSDIGTSDAVIMAAAILAFSGTGELAYASVIASGGGLAPAVGAALLVSSRFGLLAMSMAKRWPAPAWERAAMAHITGEAQVAAALVAPDPAAARRAYWQVALAMSGGWVVGSALGLLLGNVIGDTKAIGLDAVFPASLIAVVVGALRRRDTSAAAALGAVIALALTPFTPGGVPILVASVASVVALAVPATAWKRAA